MITVEEAHQIILSSTRDFGTEEVKLEAGLGRVLREQVTADRPFPPYDRVTMDGIAICFTSYKNGQRIFPIAGVAAAGAPLSKLEDHEKCLEAMTGAILPEGTDTIIRYEDLTIKDGQATINTDQITFQKNVHFKGLDRKKGDILLKPGVVLTAAEIGICATVGKHRIRVSRLPRTLVISTGDELVDIDQNPLPHQIRKSNVYRMHATLKSLQVPVTTTHLDDAYDEIVSRLRTYVSEYDVILLSGGVSMGKFDFIPKALEELNVKKHFHKIAQRPGKPFWFGSHADGAVVFAFPGNPVSSFMCMQRYFIPWLEQCILQDPKESPMAILGEEVTFKPDLTYFLEVKLQFTEKGELLAMPSKGNGSGDLANLAEADAFLVLPMGSDIFKKGEVFPVIPYRNIW